MICSSKHLSNLPFSLIPATAVIVLITGASPCIIATGSLLGSLAPIHPRRCDDVWAVSAACCSQEKAEDHSVIVKALQAQAWLLSAAASPTSLMLKRPRSFALLIPSHMVPSAQDSRSSLSAGLSSRRPLWPSSGISALGSLLEKPSSVLSWPLCSCARVVTGY